MCICIVCILHLNGGPLEKQLQLKSQPSLKIFNNKYNNNTNNESADRGDSVKSWKATSPRWKGYGMQWALITDIDER